MSAEILGCKQIDHLLILTDVESPISINILSQTMDRLITVRSLEGRAEEKAKDTGALLVLHF